MNRKNAMRWGIPAVVLLAVLIAVTGARYAARSPESETETGEAASAKSIVTAVVQTERTTEYAEATGTVKASQTADLSAKIMSKVSWVAVREGDRVRRGQTLVRLEAADLAARVQQAEAAVESARAMLKQAQTGVAIQQTQSSTRVEQARAALEQAKQQLSMVEEGARRQQKQGADEQVRQAEAAVAQAKEGVRQAEAALAAARAQLSLVREGARRQQKLQADSGVRQAKSALDTAQATYNRFKPLADEGVISRQRFDEIALQLRLAQERYETAKQQASMVHEGARTQEIQQAEAAVRRAEAAAAGAKQQQRQAEAALAAAKAQRDLTYEGARTQEVKQAEAQVRQAEEALRMAIAATAENAIKAEDVNMLQAQVRQAEANLTAARTQLQYATITAPFHGIVTARLVDPGDMAAPGQTLVRVVDDGGYRLDAELPESQVTGVRIGGRAEVTIDALGKSWSGTILRLVPEADAASRTFIAQVGLPSAPGLAPGLFGRVRIPTGQRQTLHVPETALWRRGSLAGVMLVEGGRVQLRLVTVGRVSEGKAEILSGLDGGETIVAEGANALEDGRAVRVISTPS